MIATLSFLIENVYNHYIVLLVQWYNKLCHLAEYTGSRPRYSYVYSNTWVVSSLAEKSVPRIDNNFTNVESMWL